MGLVTHFYVYLWPDCFKNLWFRFWDWWKCPMKHSYFFGPMLLQSMRGFHSDKKTGWSWFILNWESLTHITINGYIMVISAKCRSQAWKIIFCVKSVDRNLGQGHHSLFGLFICESLDVSLSCSQIWYLPILVDHLRPQCCSNAIVTNEFFCNNEQD